MALPLDRIAAACLLIVNLASAATYEVGAGQAYANVSSLPALLPGDIVEIASGAYNEVKLWSDSGTASQPIIIRGVGATSPVFDATGLDVDGVGSTPRAVFQIQASYVTIENIELENATNGNNGAAIRVTGGGGLADHVTIVNCHLHDCDMGAMSDTADHLLFSGCEIDDNGTSANSGYSHNCYLGGENVTLSGCSIHDALYGQNVKTRCHDIALLYNWIAYSQDGEVGMVDAAETAPANSNAVMIGNIVVSMDRGAGWNDARFVLFGSDEGGAHTGTLYAIANTFIAGTATIDFLQTNRPEAGIVAESNILFGADQISTSDSGPASGSSNWLPTTAIIPAGFTASTTGTLPGFTNAALNDYHLVVGASCIGIAAAAPTYLDGNGMSQPGTPIWTYDGIGNLVARTSALDAGAYEYAAPGVPMVALTAPEPQAIFSAPASILLTAGASELGGTIASVSFYQGTTLLGTSTTAPYAYTWGAVAAGNYVLSAQAIDGNGTVAMSQTVPIGVVMPGSQVLTITITAPSASAVLTAPVSTLVQATTTTTGEAVSEVDFYQDGMLLGRSFAPPYSASLAGLAPGTTTLTAEAIGSLGDTATSQGISITVAAPPAASSGGSNRCGGGALVGLLLILAGISSLRLVRQEQHSP